MIILLSPAKTLDFETPTSVTEFTQPDFLDQSRLLIDRLRQMSPAELASLMGVSDRLAVLNVVRHAEWALPFSPAKARQAILAFNGDVYEALDASSLASDELSFAQRHVRILSGLHGVLRPLDLILPYRLEMGIPLDTMRGGDLYAFWGDRITEALNAALRETQATAVVNLASTEYFRAVKPKNLSVAVIQPVFEDWSGGRFKVVSFYAKRARGRMARYAITRRLLEPAGLMAFSEDGYAFDAAASDDLRWVFRRKQK